MGRVKISMWVLSFDGFFGGWAGVLRLRRGFLPGEVGQSVGVFLEKEGGGEHEEFWKSNEERELKILGLFGWRLTNCHTTPRGLHALFLVCTNDDQSVVKKWSEGRWYLRSNFRVLTFLKS